MTCPPSSSWPQPATGVSESKFPIAFGALQPESVSCVRYTSTDRVALGERLMLFEPGGAGAGFGAGWAAGVGVGFEGAGFGAAGCPVQTFTSTVLFARFVSTSPAQSVAGASVTLTLVGPWGQSISIENVAEDGFSPSWPLGSRSGILAVLASAFIQLW